MNYLFIERDSETAVASEVARVEVNDGDVIWKKDISNIQADLPYIIPQDAGDWDKSNPADWQKLPELISGSMLWVEVEKPSRTKRNISIILDN